MESPLAGGVDQAGAVVRLGDTVRRPGGDNAQAVRLLLAHLARSGFAGAPRFLGLDDRDRELLDQWERELQQRNEEDQGPSGQPPRPPASGA